MVGRLFRHRNRPRICLDLEVGSSHVVEVLLQLRRSDWDWYKANEEAVEEELLQLLEESVLSRMFTSEIEDFHRKHNPQLFPTESNVGSKNKRKKGGAANNNNHIHSNSTKRGRKAGKPLAPNLDKKVESLAQQDEDEEGKKIKDVYYAFGEKLQLAYRKQDQSSGNQDGRTVFFKSSEEGDGFWDRPKLPGRLLIWCSKINADNKTNPDPDNVGFFREEMIPMSSLFRPPKDLE